MEASIDTRASRTGFRGSLLRLLGGYLMLSAAACGGPEGSEWAAEEELGALQAAITGGWTPLTLINGWQSYPGASAPAVGLVNGVVTFRGALQGNDATSNVPFVLPAAFRGVDRIMVRAAMGTSAGGTLEYEPDSAQGASATANAIKISQDGVSTQPGPEARSFTSLDGVSFDQYAYDSEPILLASGWTNEYGFRLAGSGSSDGLYTYVKLVNGFVRFQGYLTGIPNAGNFLFTLPPAFRPGQVVYLPVTLCPGVDGNYGRLVVYPSGSVYVGAEQDFDAARCGTSLEGTSYALSPTPQSLSLTNGWTAYSPRAVKVRSTGGVVRFEGAIDGGTNATIATLPLSMRPPATVRVVAEAHPDVAREARLVIEPSGTVRVAGAPLSTTSLLTSLDSVSFGL